MKLEDVQLIIEKLVDEIWYNNGFEESKKLAEFMNQQASKIFEGIKADQEFREECAKVPIFKGIKRKDGK